MISGNIKIFLDHDERVNLLIGIVIILASVLLFSLGYFPSPGSPNQIILLLLVQFLFLNTIHVGLTFFTLFRLPEFKAYLAGPNVSLFLRGRFRLLLPIILLLLTFCLRGGIPRFLSFRPSDTKKIIDVIGVFFAWWAIHHIQSQFRGLAMLYDRNALSRKAPEPSSLARIRLGQKLDKFFHLTIALAIMGFYLQTLIPISSITTLVFYLGLFGSLGLLVNAFSSWKIFGFGKGIYLLRMLLLPFSVYSYIFIYAAMSLHGIEYFCLTNKMVTESNKKSDNEGLNLIFWGFLFGVLIFTTRIFAFYGDSLISFGMNNNYFFLVFVVGDCLVQLHYFLDGIIFRFHNAEIRQHLGSLVITDY